MKIHVAMVSDQTLANLIPTLMDRPDKVVLVCIKGMAKRGLDRRLATLALREVDEGEPARAPRLAVERNSDHSHVAELRKERPQLILGDVI